MSQVQIRRLNEKGLTKFRHLISVDFDGSSYQKLDFLQTNEDCLIPPTKGELPANWILEPEKAFGNKFELGEYLFGVLGHEPLSEPYFSDQGLWSWIALCYLTRLLPEKRNHQDEYRFILSKNQSEGYRHLIRTPYLGYALHKNYAFVILDGPLHSIGGAGVQRFARTWHFTNQALFEAMYKLYVKKDPKTGKPSIKRGARTHAEAGTLLRLSKVVNQLELTFDLRSMNADEILDLLPPEFDRYKGDRAIIKPLSAPKLRLASQPSLGKTKE
jgi:hypothetical protein